MCYDLEVLGHIELKTIGLDLSLFILGLGGPTEAFGVQFLYEMGVLLTRKIENVSCK